jgi:hypothetical protein
MKPTILFLFNSSHYAVQPWLDDGRFECVSVDYDETDHSATDRPQEATQGHTRLSIDLSEHGAREIDRQLEGLGLAPPSFILSFTCCTDLAVSGAAHFARKRAVDPLFQERAVGMARIVEQWECPSIVENPVSVLATLWKPCSGYVMPWWFGADCPVGEHPEFPTIIPPLDAYNKKTGLWCTNGAQMPVQSSFTAPDTLQFPGHTQLGGKSARTKYIRSLTPRGMAAAIKRANCESIMDTFEQ